MSAGISFAFGLAVFGLVWHGSVLLGKVRNTGGGRPGVAAVLGVAVSTVGGIGGLGAICAVAATGYAAFMWWEVWREFRRLGKPAGAGNDDAVAVCTNSSPSVADIMSARDRYMERMHGATASNSGSRVWESENEPKRARSKRGGARRAPAGKYVDVVRFDYEDRDGAETTREVEVTGINSEYLQGWCTTRLATRSFRLDRIIGEVISIDTGEVDSAYGWAWSHMDHPNNRGISDEGWYR